MVLINKQPILSCHMASMPINNRRLIKPVMLICFCSGKFLFKGVNIVSFPNDHNIISSLICGGQNEPPMEFLDPFLQVYNPKIYVIVYEVVCTINIFSYVGGLKIN